MGKIHYKKGENIFYFQRIYINLKWQPAILVLYAKNQFDMHLNNLQKRKLCTKQTIMHSTSTHQDIQQRKARLYPHAAFNCVDLPIFIISYHLQCNSDFTAVLSPQFCFSRYGFISFNSISHLTLGFSFCFIFYLIQNTLI